MRRKIRIDVRSATPGNGAREYRVPGVGLNQTAKNASAVYCDSKEKAVREALLMHGEHLGLPPDLEHFEVVVNGHPVRAPVIP